MAATFDLVITADTPSLTAEFYLRDGHGSQLAYRQTDFHTISISRQRGLFDLRNYLRNYVETGQESASLAEIGVCIAEQVLGEEIFTQLWQSQSQRTLRIQLPGATEEENLLAAALARVPWEIGRPAPDQDTLADRNLLVRVVHTMDEPATQPLALGPNESLRVLFVFAEARGSRPLAARRERRALLDLFRRDVYPTRRVVAHVLSHGVTRQRLEAQIQENGGYHIVHWSGHGHLNQLELAQPGGDHDQLSGQELLDVFVEAGGFMPRLFFLSTCYSGDILRVKDWDDFLAVAQGQELDTKQSRATDNPEAAVTKDIPMAESPGYTGIAHALLQGGVPSVVAMRYAVGDEYSRDLGVEFYQALLAQAQPKAPAAALTFARRKLQRRIAQGDGARYTAWDPATPVLYGAEQPQLTLPPGRSPDLTVRNPRLHTIAEFTLQEHPYFVGRTWELDGLGADFIGAGQDAHIKPVALITGLGGMGKTALVAEALDLWQSRFEWVLLYQAKPNPLNLDTTLRDIHLKLVDESGRYYQHIQAYPADAIYRDPSDTFTGPTRHDRLVRNLVRALTDEPMLLVLDNFETNLKPQAESGSGADPRWACQDPAWDRALQCLATELVGTPSRVLITCRRPLAALANTPTHLVLLGPLTAGEAALYIRCHAGLSHMYLGGNPADKALAQRLLQTSRFHPLLMDRLTRLATGGPALRPQLLQALDTLEHNQDYAQLSALFATDPSDSKELAYLNDALATSLDQLIAGASPEARRLLWIVALANDPEALGLVQKVWSGESPEQEQLRQIQQLLDQLPQLPAELQTQLQAMPPELRAMVDALPPRPDLAPLLRHLVAVGLVTEERTDPEDANPNLTCHALVRDRICTWMAEHPHDQGDLSEAAIRIAYAEQLEATFKYLLHKNMTMALAAGSRALVYFIQTQAYDRLGDFASTLVTSSRDPQLLAALVPPLQAAAEAAPEGKPRWSCLCYLADALDHSGRSDLSLTFFEQAATQAHTAAEAGGDAARRAWSDLGWITGNWAIALMNVGQLDAARQRHLESAEAKRTAGRPEVEVIGSELEALRIDIMQGRVTEALPQIEARLAQVEAWWQQHRAGQPVPQAPNAEALARTFIGTLDIIANDAYRAQKDWAAALGKTEAILAIKQALQRPTEDIAGDRMNRAVYLGQLRRFGEAQAELEACLEIFQQNPTQKARVLSSLAKLFDDQGDLPQAIAQGRRALALCEQLPDPDDRAISHGSLALYLKRRGRLEDAAESSLHQLAALVYRLVSGLRESLKFSRDNYIFDFCNAQATGTPLAVPTLADLLADPAFAPLATWLTQRQVDPASLQAAIDDLLAQAQQAALSQD
jgi:tetratricopeptide (TPR) repeat protein